MKKNPEGWSTHKSLTFTNAREYNMIVLYKYTFQTISLVIWFERKNNDLYSPV